MIKNYSKKNRILAAIMAGWMVFVWPVAVSADDGSGASVTVESSSAECSGCGQGEGQGEDQGGPSFEDLGGTVNEEGEKVLPDGVEDTRQGAGQGEEQGDNITASNENTGADSTNSNNTDTDSSTQTSVNNTVNDATSAGATASSGENQQNNNTKADGVKTGSAGIGVTQVKQDNTAVVGGSAGLTVTGHNGNMTGDLVLGAGSGTANIGNDTGGASVKATNSTTGSGSENTVGVNTETSDLVEVQNDGRIDNLLNLAAISGRNEANENTSDGQIQTGDADVAATLINLLNTSVINGNIWVTVADIFGDLNGNIVVPSLSSLAIAGSDAVDVQVGNSGTGADSDNNIDIGINDSEATRVVNDAEINTEVNAEAITGQNSADDNTGGASMQTGNASVDASNVTIANTTIEGGSWGLYLVNALNGWLGYLVSSDGQAQQLSQEETLRRIEANNNATGSGSENTVDVDVSEDEQTEVTNTAVINNEVNAAAITGENEASRNTGAGRIATGDASIKATTVNIANTTVKDGSLMIAVVNIFGNWLGDLIYDGNALARAGQGDGLSVTVDANNSNTGSNSENNINVDVNREKTTEVENEADVTTTLNASVDTGGNRANRNTGTAGVETGTGKLGLFAHNLANLTGIADGASGVSVEMDAGNSNTGQGSNNTINVNVNDTRTLLVNNNANVQTAIGSDNNPALVNTGNNEVSKNTLGAAISTGAAVADVVINNLVNRVMSALAFGGATIDAEFANSFTGALSFNSNTLDVENMTLVDILNNANISNLLDLLLNTGGNKMNDNTIAGDLHLGEVCFDGEVLTYVNEVQAQGWANIDNEADVNNDADIVGVSGDNEQNRNTAYNPGDGQIKKCPPKVARGPVPSPSVSPEPGDGGPSGGGGGEDNGDGDEGGEEGEDDGEEQAGGGEDEPREPRIAGVVERMIPPAGGGILQRFPVAGDIGKAVWRSGRSEPRWLLLSVLGLAVLGWAWNTDQRIHKQKLYYEQG